MEQLNSNDLAKVFGSDFWKEVEILLGDFAESDSEVIGPLATELQSDLAVLIERLESTDYDLLRAALDPEVAEQFFVVTAALIAFAAEEIQTEINRSC